MRELHSLSGARSSKWTPNDLTEVPPVPPLPVSASLSASLNSPRAQTEENRGPHPRRTSSSTDLGMLLSSPNQASSPPRDTIGAGPSTLPDSKTGGGGYFSRVFRSRGSMSQPSRHETETTSQRFTAWPRRSTSSSRPGEDSSDPSSVPPVPEFSRQHNTAAGASMWNSSTTVATSSNPITRAPQLPLQQQSSPSPAPGLSARVMTSAEEANSDFEADPDRKSVV